MSVWASCTGRSCSTDSIRAAPCLRRSCQRDSPRRCLRHHREPANQLAGRRKALRGAIPNAGIVRTLIPAVPEPPVHLDPKFNNASGQFRAGFVNTFSDALPAPPVLNCGRKSQRIRKSSPSYRAILARISTGTHPYASPSSAAASPKPASSS